MPTPLRPAVRLLFGEARCSLRILGVLALLCIPNPLAVCAILFVISRCIHAMRAYATDETAAALAFREASMFAWIAVLLLALNLGLLIFWDLVVDGVGYLYFPRWVLVSVTVCQLCAMVQCVRVAALVWVLAEVLPLLVPGAPVTDEVVVLGEPVELALANSDAGVIVGREGTWGRLYGVGLEPVFPYSARTPASPPPRPSATDRLPPHCVRVREVVHEHHSTYTI